MGPDLQFTCHKMRGKIIQITGLQRDLQISSQYLGNCSNATRDVLDCFEVINKSEEACILYLCLITY